MSKGQLQHDLWGVKPPSDRWDWNALRADIAAHGVRNSLLVAPMPTASTSQARLLSQTRTDRCRELLCTRARDVCQSSDGCIAWQLLLQ